MARVELEKLTPGMRLRKPVFNLHGILLLKEGEVLTEKHLGIFARCGIREVDVAREGGDSDVPAEAALPREIREAVETEMAHRFRRADPKTDPVVAEILRVVMLRLCQQHADRLAITPETGPETA